jgi:glucan 1,3-beta-glucosidase
MEVNDSFLTNKLSKGLMWLIIEYTAPGSQNGFDNSGRRGNIEWQQGLTVNQTLDAIQALASRYVNDADVVAAIELLNEPFVARGVQLDPLKQFYYDGWGRIRQYSHDTTVVIHDGFLDPVSAWNGFMNAASGVWYVMLDTHHYEIFDSGQLQISTDQHIQAACSFGSNEVAKTDKWTIVGEWTGALTDCAKYLNGRGVGARYDGTYPGSTAIIGSCDGKSQGSVAGLSADDQTSIRRFIEAQLDAFEMNTGWIYWTWKTEGAPEWDMQQQVAGGVFPNPVTSRQFPKAC